jgi:hypothetical protein
MQEFCGVVGVVISQLKVNRIKKKSHNGVIFI